MPDCPQTTNLESVAPGSEDILIAVMGGTGVGKTSFINTAANSQLEVSNSLRSCTAAVAHSNRFRLSDKYVTLIDTPGFDDTNMSDTDILKMIALYLMTIYENGCKLTGVVYMHRISDFRVGGQARRNLEMFSELCGFEVVENVVLVTSMWGTVTLTQGEARERELAADECLFAPLLSKGARLLRFDNSTSSAHDILAQLVEKEPVTLRIQRELVDEGRDISETSAGMVLRREQDGLLNRHAVEMEYVQQELDIAIAARDTQAVQELDGARRELREQIQRAQEDRDRLSTEYSMQRTRAGVEVCQFLEASCAEARQGREEERMLLQMHSHIQQTQRASGLELDGMRRELRDLQMKTRWASVRTRFLQIVAAAVSFSSGFI